MKTSVYTETLRYLSWNGSPTSDALSEARVACERASERAFKVAETCKAKVCK